MTQARRLPLPEGLDGSRVDAAVSRLFGLSRTAAAELVINGAVLLDGRAPAKSERVSTGDWIEVTLPPPPTAVMPASEPVDGLRVVHDDDDIIVVDKPVGVAAHPSPGWSGPTVTGGLAARRLPHCHIGGG